MKKGKKANSTLPKVPSHTRLRTGGGGGRMGDLADHEQLIIRDLLGPGNGTYKIPLRYYTVGSICRSENHILPHHLTKCYFLPLPRNINIYFSGNVVPFTFIYFSLLTSNFPFYITFFFYLQIFPFSPLR